MHAGISESTRKEIGNGDAAYRSNCRAHKPKYPEDEQSEEFMPDERKVTVLLLSVDQETSVQLKRVVSAIIGSFDPNLDLHEGCPDQSQCGAGH